MRKRFMAVLILLVCLQIAGSYFVCAHQRSNPPQLPPDETVETVGFEDDIILVMPKVDSDSGEIKEVIADAHGTVIGTIGKGRMTVLKIKTEMGKLKQTEKKLAANKQFAHMQRNWRFAMQGKKLAQRTNALLNDPYYAQQWYFSFLNVLKAWNFSKGLSQTVALLDTGSNPRMIDTAHHIDKGFDAIRDTQFQSDVQGHGSRLASLLVSQANNRLGIAGVTPASYVYPVRIANSSGICSSEAIINGLIHCAKQNIKIVDLCFNASYPYGLSNSKANPVLHEYLSWYHDQGGLIFVPACDDGKVDNSPMLPYLIVVSALDAGGRPAHFAGKGPATWFFAPGENICASNWDGKVVAGKGSSFATTLAAGIATLAWSANPNLKNFEIESILKESARRLRGQPGFGIPDAEAATKLALSFNRPK